MAIIYWPWLLQIEAPFKPIIKDDTDVSYFDTDFTSEEPELTPPEDGMCLMLDSGHAHHRVVSW